MTNELSDVLLSSEVLRVGRSAAVFVCVFPRVLGCSTTDKRWVVGCSESPGIKKDVNTS
jgi:hypothetical protein